MGFDSIIIVIIAGIILYKFGEMFYIKFRGGKFEKLNIAEFREFMKTKKTNVDFLLIDVRNESEQKIGKIGGSINIPLNQLSPDELRVQRFKDKPIIIYCESGSRSKKAATKLAKKGFTNLYYLAGGHKLWRGDAGL